MITEKFKRTASKNWSCQKCGRKIYKGDTYQDTEIKEHHGKTVLVGHERLCSSCAGFRIKQNNYVFSEREPVVFNDIKEWLVGKGYDRDGNPCLLTLDWDLGEYHWRKAVYYLDGERLTFNNTEFV